MSSQDQKTENDKEPVNPELAQPGEPDKVPHSKDELSEETLDEVSGGALPTYKPFYVPTFNWKRYP